MKKKAKRTSEERLAAIGVPMYSKAALDWHAGRISHEEYMRHIRRTIRADMEEEDRLAETGATKGGSRKRSSTRRKPVELE